MSSTQVILKASENISSPEITSRYNSMVEVEEAKKKKKKKKGKRRKEEVGKIGKECARFGQGRLVTSGDACFIKKIIFSK